MTAWRECERQLACRNLPVTIQPYGKGVGEFDGLSAFSAHRSLPHLSLFMEGENAPILNSCEPALRYVIIVGITCAHAPPLLAIVDPPAAACDLLVV